MPITQLLVDEALNHIDSYIAKAKVTINGVESEYAIFKTLREGNVLKKFVYLDTQTGSITNAKLVDAQGRDLQTKDINITKDGDGLMIVFVIEIQLKEA